MGNAPPLMLKIAAVSHPISWLKCEHFWESSQQKLQLLFDATDRHCHAKPFQCTICNVRLFVCLSVCLSFQQETQNCVNGDFWSKISLLKLQN